jgi:hypothetical protein
MDEEGLNELQLFKKCLIKMFASIKKDVIFMETVLDFRQNRHTIVECVPVSEAVGEAAPMYFKVRHSSLSLSLFFFFSC